MCGLFVASKRLQKLSGNRGAEKVNIEPSAEFSLIALNWPKCIIIEKVIRTLTNRVRSALESSRWQIALKRAQYFLTDEKAEPR